MPEETAPNQETQQLRDELKTVFEVVEDKKRGKY
jgi:hypothetical protein